MKVISANVNGIRSAHKKGFFEWLKTQDADFICLQEIKADLDSIPLELINWNNYKTYFHSAVKKGYSGVAIYTKQTPDNVTIGLGNSEIDDEGRYLQLDYGDVSIISLYLPSGSSGEDKQQKKFRFMEYYMPILQAKINSNRRYIICGDWNIAHTELDLKNWKGNLKNSGFLPEERQWMTDLLNLGFIDTWRHLYPDNAGYTWWSNRGQAYQNNVGWRIDYQIATPHFNGKLVNSSIYKDTKFSDHAPLIVNYTME